MRLIERGTILMAVMIGTATAPLHARPVQETKKILMVYGHDPNAPGVAAFVQQLKSVVSERTRLCEPAPLVLGDRVQLQQVLLNLVMNSCDAMNDTPPGERLLVVSTATLGDARIEVCDRGSGIAPDALASVFEPFVTTKQDGLGLGLAICRSILTAQGGHISAANNPERGATFVVSLPLAADRRAAVSDDGLAPAMQNRDPG
jgi:signal transduction histidine kinase